MTIKVVQGRFMEICLQAPAKINLTLNVCGKREDGYHLLESVMQTISLCDQVRIAESKEFCLSCDNLALPTDQSNLAYKAWALLKNRYELPGNVRIELSKRIPLAGGLAGGSTDCAAVLKGVNRLFGLGLSDQTLRSLAAELGSDVPFCVGGGTALATGVGDQITELAPCPEFYVLAVNGGFEVSTPRVYGALRLDACPHPDVAKMQAAIRDQDLAAIFAAAGNSLEQPAFELFPALAAFKAQVGAHGFTALLSGSGGTVLGFTDDWERAEWALEEIGGSFRFAGAYRLLAAAEI